MAFVGRCFWEGARLLTRALQCIAPFVSLQVWNRILRVIYRPKSIIPATYKTNNNQWVSFNCQCHYSNRDGNVHKSVLVYSYAAIYPYILVHCYALLYRYALLHRYGNSQCLFQVVDRYKH
jgi:hypothetical protein